MNEVSTYVSTLIVDHDAEERYAIEKKAGLDTRNRARGWWSIKHRPIDLSMAVQVGVLVARCPQDFGLAEEPRTAAPDEGTSPAGTDGSAE